MTPGVLSPKLLRMKQALSRIVLLLAGFILVAGCGPSAETERLLEEVRAAQDQLEQRNQSLEDARARYARELSALAGDAEKERLQSRSIIADLEQRINAQIRTIEDLNRQVKDLSTAPPPLEVAEVKPPPAAPSEPTRPPRYHTLRNQRIPVPADDFLEPPGPDNPDQFPVKISSVTGRRVVTGTHTVHTPVDGEELERNEFGEKRPVIQWKESEIEQAEYEVHYALQNLTKSPKTVQVRAGLMTVPVELEPGETRTNLAVRAARGSGLRVRVSSRSRSVPVVW